MVWLWASKSWSMVPTSCAREQKWKLLRQRRGSPVAQARPTVMHPANRSAAGGITPAARAERPPQAGEKRYLPDARPANESVAFVHSAAGSDFAADARDPAVRSGGIPYAADLGAARGGLPDDAGHYALSRRQPGRDDLVRHCAAGAAVRPDAGPEPDVILQFRRRLGHHAAVQSYPRPRCRGTGSAGGDQRC